MIRLFFIYVLPLIAPTVVYLLWCLWHLKRGTGTVEGDMATVARRAPWPKLTIAGVALLIVVIAIAALTGGEPPHESYAPPHMENGKVVPGRAQPDSGLGETHRDAP